MGTSVFTKLGRLFQRYPAVAGVHPDFLSALVSPAAPACDADLPTDLPVGTVALQSVPDPLYFWLFGAIRAQLQTCLRGRAELVVVKSVNAGMGTGLVARLQRLAPLVMLLSKPWVRAYGGLADGIAYWCAIGTQPWADARDWWRAGALWRELRQQTHNFRLEIDGIEVADLLTDSYLRFRPAPAFDVHDPFVRRLLWQALCDVRRARAYFSRVRPRLYLSSYSTYLEHGIPVRVALHCGVAVWTFGNLTAFGKRLHAGDWYHTHNCSGYAADFAALDDQERRLREAQAQLDIRMSGGIDAATSYMRQSAYTRGAAEVPDGLRGAVVVFLHDFYDSPHVYADLVFDDFWRWICSTIETLQQARVPFFLKPHPNQIALSDAALAQLRHKYPSLQWIAPGLSNVQLAQAGMACGVTVYGTVAHELAYLGVPSIACARHPHHSFGFCRTARTRDEYAALLRSHTLVPLPVAEMRRQALAFYYMHNLHGAPQARALRAAFVELWKVCNAADRSAPLVLLKLRELAQTPAFSAFVRALVGDN